MLDLHLTRRWPEPPSGPTLSIRDVGLLDLARHAVMRAALPLGSIAADADDLWHALKAEADLVAFDHPEPTIGAFEPFAMAWARDRAAERQIATNGEA